MKDHEIQQMVNSLRDTAQTYTNTQQLRERIHSVIVPSLKRIAEAETIIKLAQKEVSDIKRYKSAIEWLYGRHWLLVTVDAEYTIISVMIGNEVKIFRGENLMDAIELAQGK